MLVHTGADMNGDRTPKRKLAELLELIRSLHDGDRTSEFSNVLRRARYAALVAETGDPQAAERSLERLIGGNDLAGIAYLERGTNCARSVCRIHLRDANGTTKGFGTGFLVAPGIVMTNHHVISSAREAQHALAEFDYEYDVSGRDRAITAFEVLGDDVLADETLDFCIARLAPTSADGGRSPEDFGWLVLDGTPGKAFVGEYLTIIQHPGGERKQICVRENKLLKYEKDGDTLWYQTDTVAGSSGSPVFNQSWQVVGLHHKAVARENAKGQMLTVDGKVWDPRSGDDSTVDWFANEGIRVSRLVKYLRDAKGSVLAREVVDARPAMVREPREPSEAISGVRVPSVSARIQDQELRVTIPVQIAVRVGDVPPMARHAAALGTAPPGPSRPALVSRATVPYSGDAIERVDVDQSDYAKRKGYDPNFLGRGGLVVPLPGLTAQQKKGAVAVGKGANAGVVLRYWNYSVVLDRTRRLALYSAVNVDAAKRPKGAGRDGDKWYFDTRIPEGSQLGQEFYGVQADLEADRTKNPFDRGHLTRRLDAQWGQTVPQAKRNGDDSFHWSNCSPQHWQFNQGAKRWLGLEDYVISAFAGGSRACVINGPIFDAPLSKRNNEGTLRPSVNGKRHKDPTFGTVAIPKSFFKIVACKGANRKLSVAAFFMSQEDFLSGIDRLQGMPEAEEKLSAPEAALFQVSVRDIEKLTGLDFGALAEAGGGANEALRLVDVEVIERFTQRESSRIESR